MFFSVMTKNSNWEILTKNLVKIKVGQHSLGIPGIGAIRQSFTKNQTNLINLILPPDKVAAHHLAVKLTLHIIKCNTMVDQRKGKNTTHINRNDMYIAKRTTSIL